MVRRIGLGKGSTMLQVAAELKVLLMYETELLVILYLASPFDE